MVDMEPSGENEDDANNPVKPFEFTRESLEALDKDALVEKLVSLVDQLNETKDRAQRATRREYLARLQAIQREQKLSDLMGERNDAFYCNGNTRQQLLDPFYYEPYISMKEKMAARDKTIAEHEETINTLKCSEDMKLLHKLVKSREDFSKKCRDYEYNVYRRSSLHNNLNLANSALHAVVKEKKGSPQELVEKDANIADLYKEIYQLRDELSEDVVFDDIDLEEDAKPEMNHSVHDELEKKPQSDTVPTEDDNDVVILDDVGA
ncbi:hypothetical protein NECAME_10835 [Necator americanus]|uniref:Uncharacterized protein n=1 Tax=Necator americanus TaxID=51031 RepID=W2T798_NECAM|nr:hypothetical protein NECAME_10835 [Necator americanus]ETN77743.1 hypothetical protein NECAME_10835 [Necator americanus]